MRGGSVWDEATSKVMLSCRVPEDGSNDATLLDLLTPCDSDPMALAETVVPGLRDMVSEQYVSTPHTWQRFTHTLTGLLMVSEKTADNRCSPCSPHVLLLVIFC